MTSIITAVITGLLTLAGVLSSNKAKDNRFHAELEKRQALTDQKIEELTREVRLHNNFAQRMPKVEERLDNLVARVDEYHR